jgi:hypothetical protein
MLHNASGCGGSRSTSPDRTLRSLDGGRGVGVGGTQPSRVKEVRACLNDAVKLQAAGREPAEHYKLGQRRGRRTSRRCRSRSSTSCCCRSRGGVGRLRREHGGADRGRGVDGHASGRVVPVVDRAGQRRNGGRVNFIDLERGLIDVQWQWNVHSREGHAAEVGACARWCCCRGHVRRSSGCRRAGGVGVRDAADAAVHAAVVALLLGPGAAGLAERLPASHWLSVADR